MSLPRLESTNPFTRRDEATRETRRRLAELGSAKGTVTNSGFVLDHAAQTIANTDAITALNAASGAQAAQLATLTSLVGEQAEVISNLLTVVDDLEQRVSELEGP